MLGPGLSPGIHDSLSPLLSCFTLPTSRSKLKNCHYQFTWSRIDLSDGSLKFSYFKTTLNSKPLDSNKKKFIIMISFIIIISTIRHRYMANINLVINNGKNFNLLLNILH